MPAGQLPGAYGLSADPVPPNSASPARNRLKRGGTPLRKVLALEPAARAGSKTLNSRTGVSFPVARPPGGPPRLRQVPPHLSEVDQSPRIPCPDFLRLVATSREVFALWTVGSDVALVGSLKGVAVVRPVAVISQFCAKRAH